MRGASPFFYSKDLRGIYFIPYLCGIKFETMKTEKSAYITQIEVTDFLEKGQNLCLPLNEDVTILAGDNGTGKSVLLKIMDTALNKNKEFYYEIRGLYSSVKFICSDNSYSDEYMADDYKKYTPHYLRFINSFDKMEGEYSPIYYTKDEYLSAFLDVVREFLGKNGIDIELTRGNHLISFKNGKRVYLNHLSDGQRRFLQIMFMCLDPPIHRKPLLLIDTPETFLHTDVQRILIESIRKINPNIQLLITTHSPGIILNGWFGNVVNMSQILSKVQ